MITTTTKPSCTAPRHSWGAGTVNDGGDGALWLRAKCSHCKVIRWSGCSSYCGRPNSRTKYSVRCGGAS